MDIKYLPIIESPKANDFLFLQRGTNTFKIRYSNINPGIISNDEDDMYIGNTPPSEILPGKLWGEVDNSGKLLETWVRNNDRWESFSKEIYFPELRLFGQPTSYRYELDSRYNYLIKDFHVTAFGTAVSDETSWGAYLEKWNGVAYEGIGYTGVGSNSGSPWSSSYLDILSNGFIETSGISGNLADLRNSIQVRIEGQNSDFSFTSKMTYQLIRK